MLFEIVMSINYPIFRFRSFKMLPLLRLKMAEVAMVVGNVGRALSHL